MQRKARPQSVEPDLPLAWLRRVSGRTNSEVLCVEVGKA